MSINRALACSHALVLGSGLSRRGNAIFLDFAIWDLARVNCSGILVKMFKFLGRKFGRSSPGSVNSGADFCGKFFIDKVGIYTV